MLNHGLICRFQDGQWVCVERPMMQRNLTGASLWKVSCALILNMDSICNNPPPEHNHPPDELAGVPGMRKFHRRKEVFSVKLSIIVMLGGGEIGAYGDAISLNRWLACRTSPAFFSPALPAYPSTIKPYLFQCHAARCYAGCSAARSPDATATRDRLSLDKQALVAGRKALLA